jgi:hypothetical protein
MDLEDVSHDRVKRGLTAGRVLGHGADRARFMGGCDWAKAMLLATWA